jgi:hypothetical protein
VDADVDDRGRHDRQGAPGKADSNWRKYPRAMLLARATSELASMLFSDCLSGVIYTPEELEDVAGGQQQQGQARPPAEPGTMSEANQQRVHRRRPRAWARRRGDPPGGARRVGRGDGPSRRAPGHGDAGAEAACRRWRRGSRSRTPRWCRGDAAAGRDQPVRDGWPGKKARTIADWLIANEVEADDSVVNATPEERRAIGESAGVANKAGTPPSDETWALVIDLVRQHQPAPAGDAFQGVAP